MLEIICFRMFDVILTVILRRIDVLKINMYKKGKQHHAVL